MDVGPDMNDPRFARETTLAAEKHKVARLLAELEAQGFNGDDQLILDAIEGETDAMEAVSKVLRHIGEAGAVAASLKAYEGDLASRRARYEDRVKYARVSLLNFMSEFGLKKIERPEATLSLSTAGRRVAYAPDLDPKKLPAKFQKVTVDADKAAIKAAMEADEELVLSGVYWTNGGSTLTMRTK